MKFFEYPLFVFYKNKKIGFEKNKQTNKSFSVSQGCSAKECFDPVILSMSPPSMCRETVFYKPIRVHFSLFEERKDANRSSK